MKNFLCFALLICSLNSTAIASDTKSLGVWDDRQTPMMRCYIHIEEKGAKFVAITRDCERGSERFNDDETELRRISIGKYKPANPKFGSWFYQISQSGDLEVRDSKGVVRTIPSIAEKTSAQRQAKLKAQGVSVGMQKDEVLAS